MFKVVYFELEELILIDKYNLIKCDRTCWHELFKPKLLILSNLILIKPKIDGYL